MKKVISMNLPTGKIEDRAIGVLTSIIDAHRTMSYDFNRNDKELSWDGYIYLYDDVAGKQDKAHFINKIPVQIKGHIDRNNRYLKKNSIKCSVSLSDLEVYFKNIGVVYFVIFMSEDNYEREIYYSLLFPVKIKTYLDKARTKGNKNKINIPFAKMKKSAEYLNKILMQFNKESVMQGFGFGPIVQNAISYKDIDKIKSISITAFGASNSMELLKMLDSGDVSLYGKIEGCPFPLPIEWDENRIYCAKEEVKSEISIGGKVFYKTYIRQCMTDKNPLMILSENLALDMHKFEFNFRLKTNIELLVKDAEFLLSVVRKKEFDISTRHFQLNEVNFPQNFLDILNFIVDLNSIFQSINFEYKKEFKNITTLEKENFIALVNATKMRNQEIFTEELQLVNFSIEGHYLPILAQKKNDKYDLINYLYGGECPYCSDGDNYYKLPAFIILEKKVICNLYLYNFDIFEKQILDCEINKTTISYLNEGLLKLLNLYDSSKNNRVLRLSRMLMDKIKKKDILDEYLILNDLQIKYREQGLDDEDNDILEKIESEQASICFGKYVLLRQKEKARDYYSQMSREEVERFNDYPIMHLYNELIG